jgi:7-cyano-7-deazaguanine tRNA-ribosyltransferase
MFEILKSDLAGRIGVLTTNHGRVSTPAYVPVLHPVRQNIPAAKFHELGFELVITNAYLARKNYGDTSRPIRDIIGFDGPVMTDSGGYQVLEYGDLDVTPEEMASFEAAIDSDIAIPLDRPTGFGLPRDVAMRHVRHTLKVSKRTLEDSPDNGQIWAGPIQGGEHMDLVRRSTRSLVGYGFEMLALGSPVEFMESYRYRLLAQMIMHAKRQMPPGLPLHLFGAGHPLTIPLAVALGCDTFDSASYVLYAKQGRYITEDRTRHLAEMSCFSCPCEVCSRHTPQELHALGHPDRTNNLALHNLHAIKAEVNRTREAIHEGRLWEYVFKKLRAHPKLFEAGDVLTENHQYLADGTAKFKDRAIFLFAAEDQFRPEIASYHRMVRRFTSKKRTLCIFTDADIKPAYLSPQYAAARRRLESDDVQFCSYNPFLGPMPIEISDMYPAAHHVMSRQEYAPERFGQTRETFRTFFERNRFEVTYLPEDAFLDAMLEGIKTERRRMGQNPHHAPEA